MKNNKPILRLYFIALVLGLMTGILGSAFQLVIAYLTQFITKLVVFAASLSIPAVLAGAVITMVLVLISWLLVYFVAPEACGSGVQEIEGALLHVRPIFWRRLIPIKFIAGVLSISSQMVLGREGPTIQMGGNLGEMLGEYAKLSKNHRGTMIAAGASAGLAVAFNAPLAGVLFVMEEMRAQFRLTFTNMTVAAICCVMATIVLHLMIGSQAAIITMDVFLLPSLKSLWLFLGFGLFVGLVGLLFNIILIKSLNWTNLLSLRLRIGFVMFVGALIGGLNIYYPSVVGGGYYIIEQALHYSAPLHSLAVIFVIRFIMGMVSYSTGVPGGIFAPLLALGTLLGIMASFFCSYVLTDTSIHPGMFAVAGMGALFAAVVRAPVTGIVIVIEMTHNYMLILPLMITCLTATTVVQFAKNAPIYTQLLARLKKIVSFR